MSWKGGISKNQICQNCGIYFDADHSGRKYCSRKCMGENMKGKPLIVNLKGLAYKPIRNESNFKRTFCEVCGKEFEHPVSRVAKYCSNECWSIRIDKKKIICKYCGQEIITNKKSRQVYCNKTCYYNWMSENLKGENSHLYVNGNCKETQNERLINSRELRNWRTKVFKRDNFLCVKCGSKKNIQAHHKKLWSKYKELRFDVENGMTLCHDCHQKEHNRKFSLLSKKCLKSL